MNKDFKLKIFIFALLFILPLNVFAHSGRTDANGCHTNRKTGEYHCHNAPTTITTKEARTKARISQKTEAKSESLIQKFSRSQASTEEKFVVSRIVDGDTIQLSNGKKVRYIGIDTPETVDPRKPVQCFGKEAKEANKNLVLKRTVILKKDVSETDKYGRLLRYVYLEDGTFVNLWLVKNGYAFAYTYPPDVAHSQEFLVAEREARENKRGLWGNCQTQK